MEYIEAKSLQANALNQAIQQKLAAGATELTIDHAHAMHNIGIGLDADCEIVIRDNTGMYTGSYMKRGKIVVEHSVGWYAGDDMSGGELIVQKNTGCNIGAYICGGTIAVYGSTGSRCGYGMKGGTILVQGNCGRWASIMSTGGKLVVLGSVGEFAGESMYNGAIYACDPALEEKIGGNVFVDSLTAEETAWLTQLLETYQMTADVQSFRVVRPMTDGRHHYALYQLQLDMADKNYHGGDAT